MVLSTSNTSTVYNDVIDEVISKTRFELVYNGELDESVLSLIQSKWKTKMIQAGVISGSIETSSPASFLTPVTPDPKPLPVNADNSTFTDFDAQLRRSNASMELLVSPKRERDGFCIPQQDGAKYEVPDLDEDEEVLNEDDDDEEDDTDDDDTNIPHLVMCQFDKVKRCKNKWECKFNAGVMQINGKNVLF